MAIDEKKTQQYRPIPAQKSGKECTFSCSVQSTEPELEIATALANELLNSILSHGHSASDLTSDILMDRELNGYRVILMRGAAPAGNTTTLSPREQEIARMIAKGYPNKTIAAVLELSTWTVGTHLRRMFAKLGVNSRAAMIAQLVQTYDGK